MEPRAGLDAVEKRKISWFFRESSPLPVAILTELFQLPIYRYINILMCQLIDKLMDDKRRGVFLEEC
jgi:hypothetical protein